LVFEEAGMAVDDPELMSKFHYLADNDPARLLQILLARMTPESLDNVATGMAKLPPLMREATHAITGQRVNHPTVYALMQEIVGARSSHALQVTKDYGSILMQMRKVAQNVIFAKTPVSFRGSVLRVWDKKRPSAGQKELGEVLHRAFRATGDPVLTKDVRAPVVEQLARILKGAPKEQRAEALDALSRQWDILIEFPELFATKGKGKLPQEIIEGRQAWSAMLDIQARGLRMTGAQRISRSYINSYGLTREMRGKVTDAILREGNALDVLGDVLRLAREPPTGLGRIPLVGPSGRPLRELIVLGDARALSKPLAMWESLLGHEVQRTIYSLADDPAAVAKAGAVPHFGGRWEIKGTGSWPSEMRGSLEAMMDILTRKHDWRGLTEISQTLAMGQLVADLNVVSVQAYSFVALKTTGAIGRILADPLSAPKELYSLFKFPAEIWHMTSDAGFHAWLRTNFDEVAMYTRMGLATGMESYVGGPIQRKLLLEHVPFFGKGIMTPVRNFNDLQFDRWLLYMKVHAIREHLWAAQILRTLAPVEAVRWIRNTPGVKRVAEMAGGEGEYLRRQPEHVIRACVQMVNNQMGGLSMSAQGIGSVRQAAEQIISIVPSYFRAQAGFITSAVTKPHNIQGWLATQGMARELMFAAAVSYGLSMMTGNAHRWNWADVRRADWLAVQTSGGYVPIIPRLALPRLLARSVSSVIDSAMGEGLTLQYALESFVRGRFSTLAGGIAGQLLGQDFLGRKYTDNWDRAIQGALTFGPIFTENIVTEARETTREKGWGEAWPRALKEMPLQYLGRNMVPTQPLEVLDEFSQSAYGSDWFAPETTEEMREKLIQSNPAIAAAVGNYEYGRSRREGPMEAWRSNAFRDAEAKAEKIWQMPYMVDGEESSLEMDGIALMTGDPNYDGTWWRDRFSERGQLAAGVWDNLIDWMNSGGYDWEKEREKGQKEFREVADYKNREHLVELCQIDWQAVSAEDYMETVEVETLEHGTLTFREIDYTAFRAAQEAAIQTYPADIRMEAEQRRNEKYGRDPVVPRYRVAQEKREEIETIPRYSGMTVADCDKVDSMRSVMRTMKEELRAAIGLPGAVAPLPEGMGATCAALLSCCSRNRGSSPLRRI